MPEYEDIILELARIERDALRAIAAKMASQQLGLAFVDLVDERKSDEGGEERAA